VLVEEVTHHLGGDLPHAGEVRVVVGESCQHLFVDLDAVLGFV
jgi:hypothetical protein